MFSDDGKYYNECLLRVCHTEAGNNWNGSLVNKIDQCVTSYPATSLMWFTFYDFLITHPFKEWSHLIALDKTPEGQWYIHIRDLDQWPAEVFYNFLIWTRIPWEFQKNTKRWMKYVKMGIHPSFAFVMCRTQTADDDKVTCSWDNGNSNHWPHDNLVNLEWLVSSTPHHGEVSYKKNPGAGRPCNVIWGNTSLGLKDLIGHTVPEFWNSWKAEHEDILLAS